MNKKTQYRTDGKIRKFGRKWRLGAALLVLVLSFAGCSGAFGGGNGETAGTSAGADSGGDQETVFAVTVTEAVEGQIFDYLELNGEIVAKTTVDTYPDAAGELSSIFVEVGQTVGKGELLAEVDPSRPGMTFAASPVKAAISGTVTGIPMEVGAMVSQQSPVVRISKMDELNIETYVAERFISKISEGQKALVYLDAFPGETFTAELSKMSPMLNPSSRTLDVTLEFTNLETSKKMVRAGMYARIKIITQDKEGVVKVPSPAVTERFGEDYVFVVKNGSTAEKRKVSTGIDIDGKLEILQGLEDGEVIVLRGQSLLEDGSPVKIVQRNEPLSTEDTIN
ncbi:MAG: efflux RND transporter periplasmic adaptor subunit [Spirochaetales bacterium]|nr:efflux RND transporter periplasmic adaptor subunit [Spirochaetales bacterium]